MNHPTAFQSFRNYISEEGGIRFAQGLSEGKSASGRGKCVMRDQRERPNRRYSLVIRQVTSFLCPSKQASWTRKFAMETLGDTLSVGRQVGTCRTSSLAPRPSTVRKQSKLLDCNA